MFKRGGGFCFEAGDASISLYVALSCSDNVVINETWLSASCYAELIESICISTRELRVSKSFGTIVPNCTKADIVITFSGIVIQTVSFNQ
jgi:hypothetical protein